MLICLFILALGLSYSLYLKKVPLPPRLPHHPLTTAPLAAV